MDTQDMADLIYARDAYKALNKSLHGEELVLGFHEGHLGALGRIFRVIDRNVSEKWKKNGAGVTKILDAISLSPEERARLLAEDKGRIGDEGMPAKYRFQKELKEAVLTGRIKGQATIVIDGVERKAKCHAWGKIEGEGLPCLVSESNNSGDVRYTVEAVSCDNHEGKREWTCIRPRLLEQAVGFFLENHRMEKMVGNYDYVNQISSATSGKGMPDFQVGNAWVEVRNLGRNSNSSAQRFRSSSIAQVGKHCQRLAAMKKADERMILLLLYQTGSEEKQIFFQKKVSEEIKKTIIEIGLEIWIAEVQLDTEGICLLTYQPVWK